MEEKKKRKKARAAVLTCGNCDSTTSWDKTLNKEYIYSSHPSDFYVVLHGSLIGNKQKAAKSIISIIVRCDTSQFLSPRNGVACV